MYSIRRVTTAVGGQGVWCEEKVCIIRNVRKCSVPGGSHLQYEGEVVQYEEKVYSIRREHL